MAIADIIAKKRDRKELSESEIREVVCGFVQGKVGEGPMGAVLMAIFLNGMNAAETTALTVAMASSGERLDLSHIPGVKVDKHSTGGVGDKTTLVVAPLVAALGVRVPKMSGRALGHTGGTIDKLEVIPGLTTRLRPEQFCRQVAEVGVAIASQTENLAPADKSIYALRDASATVESIPLIAASVMSKKLAVGADAILLDVKAGCGAFMEEVAKAEELAEMMVDIGSRVGKKVTALVTHMDQPLGAAVGDAAELVEAVMALRGEGPADLMELCEIVAGHMLALGGAASDPEEGAQRARSGLQSGVGEGKLREMVSAQGGDPRTLDDPGALIQQAIRAPVTLDEVGLVAGIDARGVGLAVRRLKEVVGTGKHLCGVWLHKKVGDAVSLAPAQAGGQAAEPVAEMLGPPGAEAALREVAEEVGRCFRLSTSAEPPASILVKVISG